MKKLEKLKHELEELSFLVQEEFESELTSSSEESNALETEIEITESKT